MPGRRDEATPSELGRQSVAGRSVCERVVAAVAAAEGVETDEIETPLNDAIDPEALDDVLRSAAPGSTVRFRYRGHVVVVHGDLTVDVTAEGRE